jgi:hypothetical protein
MELLSLLKFGLIFLVIACSTGKKEIGSAKSVISSANDYGMLHVKSQNEGSQLLPLSG